MRANWDWNIYRGDTGVLEVGYQEPDGTPVNLTGYSAKLQVRPKPGDSATALLELTHSSGIAINAAAGTLLVTITPAQSVALGAGRFAYDLQITSAGGIVTTLVGGVLLVHPEVTL